MDSLTFPCLGSSSAIHRRPIVSCVVEDHFVNSLPNKGALSKQHKDLCYNDCFLRRVKAFDYNGPLFLYLSN